MPPSDLYANFLILSRINLNNGNNINMIAITVIGPAIGLVKNIEKSPSESSKDCRNFGSAIGPSTTAKTAGASG